MSLTITITTPEGIVLAADSRQTYRNQLNAARIGSDSATKIFKVTKDVGLSVTGQAFLLDKNNSARNIASFIQEFINTELSKTETVEAIAKKVHSFLTNLYKPATQLERAEREFQANLSKNGITESETERNPEGRFSIVRYTTPQGEKMETIVGVAPISILVSGYNHEKIHTPELNVYSVEIPGTVTQIRKDGNPNQFGANWNGQTEIVTRLILGFDPRIETLPFATTNQNEFQGKIAPQLKNLELAISWSSMNIFDAIEIAKLFIQVTTSVQKFSDGLILTPGDIPGVGGPIDVAVITPEDGFKWHQNKRLELFD